MLYVVCCMMLLHVYACCARLLPAVCQFSSAALLPKVPEESDRGEGRKGRERKLGSQLAGSLPALREGAG